MPVDTHPTLCDSCKHRAAAHDADQQEQPESLSDWAQQKRFLRFTSRPRCTECKAAFTDERWQAVERTGWNPLPQERHPTLCQTCTQEYDDSIENAWPHRPTPSPRRSSRYRSRSPAGGSRACAPDPMRRQALRNLQGWWAVSRGCRSRFCPSGLLTMFPTSVHGDLLKEQEESERQTELCELRLIVRQVVLRWLILTPHDTEDLAPRFDAAADCGSCEQAIDEPLRAFFQEMTTRDDIRS
ncbi:hypothetical protein [Streptomyces microflavus]|uniref:Uncharacterized protein n=1 Tax=Streptomyces microflavus TaxID=1919 RepID=A0ABV1QF63_STRMI